MISIIRVHLDSYLRCFSISHQDICSSVTIDFHTYDFTSLEDYTLI